MANFVLSDPLELLSGIFSITGNVLANNANGYALLDEAASSGNPTLVPNRNFLGTGISAVDAEGPSALHIIVDDTSVFNASLSNIIATVTNTFEINGAFFVDGNADTVQLRIDAHSTQNALLFRIRDSSAATIMSVDNSGDLTLSGGVFTGPSPPGSGGLGVSNQRWIVWRNGGDSGDIEVLRVDSSDNVVLNTNAGGSLIFSIQNTTVALASSTAFAIEVGTIIDITSAEAFLIRKDSDGGDVFTVNTVNGTVTVNGALVTNALARFEGNILIDRTDQEAFLVRKDGDTGDIFRVDTTDSEVQVIGTLVVTGDVTVTNDINLSGGVAYQQEHDMGTVGATETLDWNNGNKQLATLDENLTFTFTDPPGPANLVLRLVQDVTGTNTVTWPASVKWEGGTAPVISPAGDAIDILTFYFDGTDYYGSFLQDFS